MSAPLPATDGPCALADDVPFPPRVVPLVTLDQAAELVPVSVRILWVEHLTLGGTADLDHFRAHLHDPDPSHPEHEIVLETLEAVLADEGVRVRVR